MAVHAVGSAAPAPVGALARVTLLRLRALLAAPRLDARLAAGEDPATDPVLAVRAAQLVSSRPRRRVARGLERACASRPARAVFSAAIPVDVAAIKVARPALEQLTAALRSRHPVRAQGVALAQVLVTEPASPLYRSARAEELYELTQAALLALAPDAAGTEE